MKLGPSARGQLNSGLQTRIDPKIVLGSQILQLNQAELEMAVESELLENPALERMEEHEEPVTHEEILRAIAPGEIGTGTSGDYEHERSLPRDGEQSQDWTDFAPGEESLPDHLMAQLTAMLPPELHLLASYFIGSLDERGYLKCSVEEAALDSNSTLEEAEHVHQMLMECEPEGVGATDLRECLLLQLRSATTLPERLARKMIECDWEDLVARNARAIMRRYKADEMVVQAAFDVILSLNPFPGEAFRPSVSVRQNRTIGAMPDVCISMDERGWNIEVPGPSPVHLRVSRAYESRFKQLQAKGGTEQNEKRHISEFVERANRFLDALSQRRRHMAAIAQFLIERQPGFIQTGDYKFLQPLTRSQMAKDLGLHESTVSRATNGKFLQIASGEVVSFDVLFKPALRIQKIIEEILETENPDNPLSDERIAQILAEQGINVARRTVNKYRDRNKLLSSRHRRSA
jgi:RNA polymerase sigma-54 factor